MSDPENNSGSVAAASQVNATPAPAPENHQDQVSSEAEVDVVTNNNSNEEPKEVIATKVSGTVKWFNVKSGYGFINRNDTKEDVFVHQTAIAKNNPKKAVRSVGDGELVEFDVVVGEKGNEASNVTGPEGQSVKGSPYAADRRRGTAFRRGGSTRGGYYRGGKGAKTPPTERGDGDEPVPAVDDNKETVLAQVNGAPRGRGGYNKRYRPRYVRRGGPRPIAGREEDGGEMSAEEGAPRGRGRGRGGFRGGFRGRGFRGGFRGGYRGISRGGSYRGGRGVPRGRGRGRGGPRGGRGGGPVGESSA